MVNNQEVEPGATAGTIGLDVLIGQVVVLDFPAKRIYLMLRADLPAGSHGRRLQKGPLGYGSKLGGAVIAYAFE